LDVVDTTTQFIVASNTDIILGSACGVTPDGSRLFINVGGSTPQVLDASSLTHLANTEPAGGTPIVFTPDGKFVYFGARKLDATTYQTIRNIPISVQKYGAITPGGTAQIKILSYSATSTQGTNPIVGVPVAFLVVVDHPDRVVEVQWDFDGDGKVDLTDNETNAEYTYTQPGTYQARVEVFGVNPPSATAVTTVTLQSPAQATSTAISLVQQLPLSSGNKNSLISKLTDAQNLITRGNINGACGKLGDFVSEMNTLVKTGRLSAQNAAPVLDQVGAIQTSLQCK
jgi:hypothetical protein